MTAKVSGPRSKFGWLPVFHVSLKEFSEAFIMYIAENTIQYTYIVPTSIQILLKKKLSKSLQWVQLIGNQKLWSLFLAASHNRHRAKVPVHASDWLAAPHLACKAGHVVPEPLPVPCSLTQLNQQLEVLVFLSQFNGL